MFHFSEGRRTFAGAKYIATLISVPHAPYPFVVVVGGGGDGSQWFALCEGYLHFTPCDKCPIPAMADFVVCGQFVVW